MAGAHYPVTDAVAEPKPVQYPLPILIGGKGDRMMGVIARYADEWNMWGLAPTSSPSGPRCSPPLRGIGRDPGTIARSAQALVRLTDDPAQAERFLAGTGGRAAIAGTTEQVAEAVAGVAGGRARRGHRPGLRARPGAPSDLTEWTRSSRTSSRPSAD